MKALEQVWDEIVYLIRKHPWIFMIGVIISAILMHVATLAWAGELKVPIDAKQATVKVYEKGHCPHCGRPGKSFIIKNYYDTECKEMSLPTRKYERGFAECTWSGEGDMYLTCENVYGEMCTATIYRCPTGHLYWEKE